MNLGQLRKVARAHYGGSRWNDEDPLWNQLVLHDIINRQHRWLAEKTRCYRETQTYNVTAGTSSVSLNCNVIDLDPFSVRAYLNGTWQPLDQLQEQDLYLEFGTLDNLSNADPTGYWLRMGTALDAQRVLELFPPPLTTTSSGLKLNAYIYPALMSSDTDTPALQPAEHNRLIPAICWGMAELEMNRGVQGAATKVQYWQGRAEQDAAELKRIIDRFRRPGPRRVRYEPDGADDTGYRYGSRW